jgi:hypothetical protein
MIDLYALSKYTHSMEVQLIPKSSQDRFNTFLSHQEFRCKCSYDDCSYTLVLDRTVSSFFLTRKHFGKPIIVTSGFRCQRHNKDVGGLATSFHKAGAAIDIQPRDLADLDLLEQRAKVFFDVVIRYDTFLHCHNTED